MSAEPLSVRPIKIEGPFLLLVEGKDEVQFFLALLQHMGIEGVQVLDYAGKNKFPEFFPAVCLQLDPVRAYAVVRDADANAGHTLESIAGVLKKQGEPCPRRNKQFEIKRAHPRKVGVYVLPGDAEQGMLEDLCLSTVQDHPATDCVNVFMECIERVLPKRPPDAVVTAGGQYYPKNRSKARALAFLAAMHDEVHHVGEAAQGGCWDLDHPCLAELKAFLQHLAGS
ncbi:MAG: hypothetical protein IMZ65_03040 [Planctomycetes bacterium]|nr:hypothetical protein [Planctomycetota bacterium]